MHLELYKLNILVFDNIIDREGALEISDVFKTQFVNHWGSRTTCMRTGLQILPKSERPAYTGASGTGRMFLRTAFMFHSFGKDKIYCNVTKNSSQEVW